MQINRNLERNIRTFQASEILVVTKQSKVEYDQRRLGLNTDELISYYRENGVPLERIFASHDRQKAYTKKLLSYFQPSQIVNFISGDNQEVIDLSKKFSLVLSFGGDNHFQRVAKCLEGGRTIAGVNSDPQTSRGVLLPFSADSLDHLLDGLTTGNYKFSPWTRMNVTLNGTELPPVLCDVFVGERERQYMSRYILEAGEKKVEQKSSGLLVATGAGSGGWFSSATRYLFPEGAAFGRESREIKFAATEISKTGNADLPFGVIDDGSVLRIQSLNDSEGILALDSLENFSFPPGHKAEIRAAEKPLWTIQDV